MSLGKLDHADIDKEKGVTFGLASLVAKKKYEKWTSLRQPAMDHDHDHDHDDACLFTPNNSETLGSRPTLHVLVHVGMEGS